MRNVLVVACLAAAAACGADEGAHVRPPTVPGARREAPPTTRLVLPGREADRDCADFPGQAAAQRALRTEPSDPHHLDADRDGIACEKLR